jgi:hypothetical protein
MLRFRRAQTGADQAALCFDCINMIGGTRKTSTIDEVYTFDEAL